LECIDAPMRNDSEVGMHKRYYHTPELVPLGTVLELTEGFTTPVAEVPGSGRYYDASTNGKPAKKKVAKKKTAKKPAKKRAKKKKK
jgi:hypothetical protein